MYSVEEFSDVDKTNFKCYKFEDDSIYYGEVIYVTPDNVKVDDPNTIEDEEEKANIRLVRHGMGAQFFGVNADRAECQYEGEWTFDKKNGKGTARFTDGSSYEGEFKDDKFSGLGKFIWKVGHIYIGSWKDGRMEGEGLFTHQDGHILRGQFSNNFLYDKERGIFVDPFLSTGDSEKFKKEYEQHKKNLLSKETKCTKDNIKQVYNKEEIISLMEDCIQEENKTPLLLRTVERRVDKEEIFSHLPYEHVEIDLKEFYQNLRKVRFDSPEMRSVYDEMKKRIMDAIINGKYLILNYDDTKSDYDELFDPSLQEIYKNFMLSPLIFNPKKFAEKENFEAHIQHKEGMSLNPKFRFLVYSKFLITDLEADEEKLNQIVQKKFKDCLPLKDIKVFILSKMKVEEKKENLEEIKEEEEKEDQSKAKVTNKTGKK